MFALAPFCQVTTDIRLSSLAAEPVCTDAAAIAALHCRMATGNG
jgi:hypothetical protein